LVFAAMIVCLAVLEATSAGLGHPAGWLERATGQSDTVPRFAQTTTAPTSGRPVRIVSLADEAQPAPTDTVAPRSLGETPSVASQAEVDSAPESDRPAPQSPAVFDASAPVRIHATSTATRSAPLRVYVAGDSAAEPLGYEIQRLSAREGQIAAIVDFKVSSGLANPSYFDWPARLERAVAARPPPEVVVLFLGGNDHLQMRGPKGMVQPEQPAWVEEYMRRAGEMMDLAGRAGAQVYWVGMPVVRDRGRNGSVAAINAALVAAAAERPWVHVLDVAPLFGDVERDYSAFRPDKTGELTKVRQDDGIHLTNTGSGWLAALVYGEIARDLNLSP
jgi:hypothetical protein